MTGADRVRAYYADLRTGDADAVARHFSDDAVHYYTRREPHRGREIADYAALGATALNAVWTLEHVIDGGDEVAIEWSMAFDHPRTGERMLDRGAEFFLFAGDDNLIREVRAYYGERGGDLRGFDHAGRGHSTLGAPASEAQPA